MIAAFFEEEPEKFDIFWETIGNKHIDGQKRAARSRSKKARSVCDSLYTSTDAFSLV